MNCVEMSTHSTDDTMIILTYIIWFVNEKLGKSELSGFCQKKKGQVDFCKLSARRLAGGKSRDFNAGMAEKMPHDCIGLG